MIYINDIASFRDPEKNFFTPDDRQEKIETIGGIVVQDLGRVIEGDVLALQCMFTAANYARLEELIVDSANKGNVYRHRRADIPKHASSYKGYRKG